MNTYYLKILLFSFLIHILVLPHNEIFVNNHYNRSLIQNNTKRTTIKSRLLAQTQKHNPHYHNDPELKEMIDKLNDEAIKKYQQTHDPYKKLKELVEKKGTKITGGSGEEHMSTTEKDLFETYKEVFGEENHIMLKSGMYPNDDDKSSSCVCNGTNNMKVTSTKGKDKYLENLKERCKGGIGFCSVGSAILTYIGLNAAKAAAAAHIATYNVTCNTYGSLISMYNIFSEKSILATIEAAEVGGKVCGSAGRIAEAVPMLAMETFSPYGIASVVILVLVVVTLIILYIWLYRRRKNSWKHECKKHLCK